MASDLSAACSQFCRNYLCPILAWFLGIGCAVVATGALAWLALYTFDTTQQEINKNTVSALDALTAESREQSEILQDLQVDMGILLDRESPARVARPGGGIVMAEIE